MAAAAAVRAWAALLALAAGNAQDLEISPFLDVRRMVMWQQPGNGTGGTALDQQPKIVMLDDFGRLVNTSANSDYDGKLVTARFLPSALPAEARYAVVQQEGVTDPLVEPSAEIIGGWANFTGLYVNDLASGFKINFWSKDFGMQVDSEQFNVELGPPHELVLLQQPGTATGGLAFKPQPTVGIVDKGNNPITWLNTGTINVSLCEPAHGLGCVASPGGELLLTDVASATTVDIIDGAGSFAGLAIDKAGFPYQLRFQTSYTGLPEQTIASNKFTVGVGRAVEVRIETNAAGARGGLPFTTQPVVSMRDTGGNLVTENSLAPPFSQVLLHLGNNPTAALLSSDLNQTRSIFVEEGFASGLDFKIDKIGQGYQIRFTAVLRTPDGDSYEVIADSPPFDVTLGEPTDLEIQRPVAGAFAGGLPFYKQPIVVLVDGGGNVFSAENSAVVTADLVVSPSGYPLLGEKEQVFFRGVARFRSLKLVRIGTGYVVQFSTTVSGTYLAVNHTFQVLPSLEFEFMAEDAEPNDHFGESVSVFDETALVGAPMEDLSIREVQRISTTTGAAVVPQNEIQRVQLRGVHQAEIQEVVSCGGGGTSTSLLGYFTLTLDGTSTRPLRYDIHETVLKDYIEADLDAGSVTVEKVVNNACDAGHTYKWTIYFDTREGEIGELVPNFQGTSVLLSPDPDTFYWQSTEFQGMSSASSATGVNVTVTTLQDSPTLAGKFRLAVGGDGTALGADVEPVETEEIEITASELDVKQAVEAAVRQLQSQLYQTVYATFNLEEVTRTGPDGQGGYTWDIMFPNDVVYDWRLMQVNTTLLTGLGAEGRVTTVQEGRAPLLGQFRLWFNGEGPTDLIPYDADASVMEARLEGLPTINDVEVTRSAHSLGHTWTVTFISTNTKGMYGFVEDDPKNLPPLKADTYMLTGTGARVWVEYTFAVDDMETLSCASSLDADASAYDVNSEPSGCTLLDIDQFLLPEDKPVMGKMGHETGAAYVVYRDPTHLQWLQVAKLRADDGEPFDQFGWSVSLDNTTSASDVRDGVAVVGAPGASYRGNPESQAISCTATSGTFGFRFRAQHSAFVALTVTAPELEAAIEATPTITDVKVTYYLESIQESNALASNSGHALCQPASATPDQRVFALVEFVYPIRGNLPELEPITMDLLVPTTPLLLDATAPVGMNGHQYGVVTVVEHQRGTILGDTRKGEGYSTGAVYVFSPAADNMATSAWQQDAKLLASDGVAGDSFGHTVRAYVDTIVVGAPGHDFDGNFENRMDMAGAVYVFTRDGRFGGEVGVWSQSQKLTVPDRQPGDRFGSAIAFRGDSIAISSPGRDDETGRVYIFKRAAFTLPFTYDQGISAVDALPGDRFGSSLALDINTLIIGASLTNGRTPAQEEEAIYMAGAEEAQGRSRTYSDGARSARTGLVYSYTRSSHRNSFQFHEKLLPRSPRPHARFGHVVTIERDLLIACEQEDFRGNLSSRRYIFEITTFVPPEIKAASNETRLIGNLFAVTWRRQQLPEQERAEVRVARYSAEKVTPANEEDIQLRQETFQDTFADIQTQWLAADVAADEMQARLEQDLETGDVAVTRTAADEDGGHTWRITFLELNSEGGRAGTVPPLGTVSRLTGDGAIEVRVVQEPPPYVHGLAHVFKRDTATGRWHEHAVLRPEAQQDGDLFCSSVGLHGRFAVVGAPNRDMFEASGINGGALYVFDMGFINIRFAEQTYVVSEDAGAASISVFRCEPACEIGIAPPPGVLPFGYALDEENEVQFLLADGTARSRAQCTLDSRGTSECLWLRGEDHGWNPGKTSKGAYVDIPFSVPNFLSPARRMPFYDAQRSSTYSEAMNTDSAFQRYDYRAISDFAPNGGRLEFAAGETSRSFEVVVTNDEVLETPDETVNLMLFAAGMRPVPGGDLWAVLTIEDDGDGGVGTQDMFDQVYATDPANFARFGSASSLSNGISAVSAPFEPNGASADEGAVYVYRRTGAGIWELEEKLRSPNAVTGGRFGVSLQVRENPRRLIVGAPGESPPTAYLYLRVAHNVTHPDPEYSAGTWELEATFALDASMVVDYRCHPDTSGVLQRCRNGHHPINSDSFYAGENAVSVHDDFAVVGAKGLEAVFVFRMRRLREWYFFQMLKSPNYEDEIYPPDSEHSKVYVKRPLFGSSVAIWSDTLVVGATLDDNERPEPADKKTDQDVGLSCTDAGFRTADSPTVPDVYKWELNQYSNAYLWSEANETERQHAYRFNEGGAALESRVSCEETHALRLTVRSSGIPDHPLGAFPLDADIAYAGEEDNPYGVKEQDHVFHIPRFPVIVKSNPRSVVDDRDALPRGPIGVALNGVPLFGPYNEDGDDVVNPSSPGFVGSQPDLCHGVATVLPGPRPRSVVPHVYGYRGNPVCLYPQPVEIAGSVPQLKTGKLFQVAPFQKDGMTNPNPGERSPKIGYALDGFPIFGPFAEGGDLPDDLDACNGRFDSALGSYVYHITPWREPYLLGCLRGKVSTEVPDVTTPFPEFMAGAAYKPRDLGFYGRGSVYTFELKADSDRPVADIFTVTGLDMQPKRDPVTGAAADMAWHFHSKLVAGDAEHGDRFGHSVALQRDQLLVSAIMDTARARSTWDFETGDLRGWMKTGTAFDNQPTFGDNTAERNVYGYVQAEKFRDYHGPTYHGSSNRVGERIDIFEDIEGEYRTVLFGPATVHRDHPVPVTMGPSELREAMFAFRPGGAKSSKLRGKFFIGTFENRPAVFDADTNSFDPQQPEGNAQGDEPQGTLTSDAFPIYGTKISFLVGGGCKEEEVYVELLVDGISVLRATGECDEAMREVVWDVSKYRWQSGILRIVDQASGYWGHINVDDFRFNWDPSYLFRSSTPASDGTTRRAPRAGAMIYSGEPLAGTVYAFRRRSGSQPDHPCEIDCDQNGCFYTSSPVNRTSCEWEEQQKLQPSDRRAHELFGWAVAIDDDSGLAVVGAPGARVVDQYNHDDMGGRMRCGAIYVFERAPEERSEFGVLQRKPFWYPNEKVKLQHPDKGESRSDQFGYSVAVNGHAILAGAPSRPALAAVGDVHERFNAASVRAFPAGGAAYQVQGGILDVSFQKKVFVVRENHLTLPNEPNRINIVLTRTGDLSTTLHVGYQTSDLTAQGVSEAKAAYCAGLDHTERGVAECGDYVLQSGVVTFDPSEDVAFFELRTMNDNCNEQYSEFVLLQLALPGGPVLLGPQYTAVLRIDDNDGEELVNRLFCPQESQRMSADHPLYSHVERADTRGTPTQRSPLPETELSQWIMSK